MSDGVVTCTQQLIGKTVRFPVFCCGRAAMKCNDMTCHTMRGCQQFRELNLFALELFF